MITFALYSKQDISLARLLLRTCPKSIKILILNFNKKDQYKYKNKRKFLGKYLSSKTISQFTSDLTNDQFIIVNSYIHYWWIMRRVNLHITKGLDIYVIKPKLKKLIILSQQRVYYSRLNQCIEYLLKSKNDLKIIMFSDLYFDKKIIGNWQLSPGQNDDYLLSKKDLLYGIDIYGAQYDILKKNDKEYYKKELNLPLDKKIAFFSFRQAADGYSIFKNSDDFMKSSIEHLKMLKQKDYFIICRRRLSKQDIDYYKKKKQPIVDRFFEVEPYIDIEINEDIGFPNTLWKLLYISDILFLSDMTNMAYLEAALCRCPIFLPWKGSKKTLLETISNHAPPLIDMMEKNLIFNQLNEEHISHFSNTIETFLSEWYNTNPEKFWSIILN